MARVKFDLLQMAKADLETAVLNLKYGSDDANIEIAAYHCAQCVEKAIKYVIKQQGDVPAPSHAVEEYIQDLKRDDLRAVVQGISGRLEEWDNQIRYEHSQKSSRESVERVIKVCQQLIDLVDKPLPTVDSLPRSAVFNKKETK